MNKFKKGVVTVFCAGFISAVAPVPVMADGYESSGKGPNPFSDCGIGAALFPDIHWAAVLSNVIWDIGTTAVTSATSSPETCNAPKKMAAAKFIIDNYDSLVEETARGEGEHVTAMLTAFGCDVNAHAGMVSSYRGDIASFVIHQNYQQQNLVEKSSDFYQSVNYLVDGEFSSSCSI